MLYLLSKILNLRPLSDYTDEELVAEFIKTRQAKYFEELHNRYAHLGYGLGLKYLKNEALSWDLISDVFEILYKKIPSSNIKSFKAYFYAVTRNEAIAKLRKQKTARDKAEDYKIIKKNKSEFMENEGLVRLMDNEPTVESLVDDAIKQLSAEQQICIKLFFFQNKSYKDISEIKGFSENQVKSYLQNGKRKLKILLEKSLKKV